MRITDEMLKDMVEVLVKEADPASIYVFGSYARGQVREDSDLDLLIVEREAFGPQRSRRREMARLWRLLAPFRIPKDILVFTQDEVARWRDTQNHVIARAIREGKVLYERPRIRA